MYAGLLFIIFRQDIPVVFRYTYTKKSTLVQVNGTWTYGETCLVYVTVTADTVENICGDKKDGGDMTGFC